MSDVLDALQPDARRRIGLHESVGVALHRPLLSRLSRSARSFSPCTNNSLFFRLIRQDNKVRRSDLNRPEGRRQEAPVVCLPFMGRSSSNRSSVDLGCPDQELSSHH